MATTGQARKKTTATAKTDTGRVTREQYPVGLSDEEREIIEAAAAATGLDRSAFCRTESVQAARRKLAELGLPIPRNKT
jgi:uncharacterized protein (DUF1778 family)